MALLCRTRLATPESLFDYDGPWSPDVMNMMIPMAEEAELVEKERLIDAVGSLFGKDGIKDHNRVADKLRDSIHARLLAARGLQEGVNAQVERDVAALDAAFAGMGKGARG